jgi:hypothetical protein
MTQRTSANQSTAEDRGQAPALEGVQHKGERGCPIEAETLFQSERPIRSDRQPHRAQHREDAQHVQRFLEAPCKPGPAYPVADGIDATAESQPEEERGPQRRVEHKQALLRRRIAGGARVVCERDDSGERRRHLATVRHDEGGLPPRKPDSHCELQSQCTKEGECKPVHFGDKATTKCPLLE